MSPASHAEKSSDEDLLRTLQKHLSEGDWRSQVHPRNYMRPWFAKLELIEAHRSGRLVWRFPVLPEYIQAFSSFAGGAQAVAHDMCTSWTMLVIARKGHWTSTGVSRSLNMSYIRPALEGDMLLLDCEIVHAGSQLAMVKGTLKREKDSAIISTSEHHKVNIDGGRPKL